MKLIVAAPFLAILCARWIVGAIDRADARRNLASTNSSEFRYSRGVSNVVALFGVLLPTLVFLVPDSAVPGLRLETDLFGLVLGGVFTFSWIYLRKYRIVVNDGLVKYGAFSASCVDLSEVTRISYYWINNGIQLKLFAGKKRLAIFEGGVENFDLFAQRVKMDSPTNVRTEVFGKAKFEPGRPAD
jgi:hypothetical protein